MVGHHVQGAAAMAAALSGDAGAQVAGCLWAALYTAYQALSVLRKQDSPGLDMADFLVGAGAGAFLVEAVAFFEAAAGIFGGAL